MAPVWPQLCNAECGSESYVKVTQPERPHNPVTPHWRLERKYVSQAHECRPVQCILPDNYLLSNPWKTATPSPPTASRSLRDSRQRTLVVHRPVNGITANKKIVSRSTGPKSNNQRPCSSLHGFPSFRPSLISARSDSAMTSSLVDKFLLHGAAGELSGIPPNVAMPMSPDTFRPILNTHSFLRPSSAKVPLHPHVDSKKTRNPPYSPVKSASWHLGEKGNFRQAGELDPSLHGSNKASSASRFQETIKRTDSTGHILEHNTVGGIPYKQGQITEAVTHVTGCQCDSSAHPKTQLEMSPKDDRGINGPSSLLAICQKDDLPCILAYTGQCLNGNIVSTTRAYSTSVCAIQVDTNVAAIGGDSCHRGSTPCQSVVKGEPHLPDIAQRVNITDMASQISTIHLNRTCVQPTASSSADNNVYVPSTEADMAEEELPDSLDDSQEEEEDEEDSVSGAPSATSVSDITRPDASTADQQPANIAVKPALTPSLFPNTPATIYFGIVDEKVEQLPWAQRKLLKWKMSTVTPQIVKQTVARSHFRVTKKSHDWLGCWGHHMKSTAFKAIQEHQKLNHFPGSFQIGRKDRLWRNLSRMQARFGRKEFNFFPQSFVLPQDIKLLRKAWETGGTRQKWIVKPPASARGMGIQVIHKWSQLPKKRPLLVQRYLHKPYLIGGSKFDLRVYVYVTSYDPLRVYLFTDGLVRFASCKYSSSMKSLSNKFMHLTNYSVNKKNVNYKANTDETSCQGHKWALKSLWNYLNQKGFSSDKIWEKIKEMVIKTIIASEPYVNSLVKMFVENPRSCHELFGFDIMLDENLKPWVLEVNISPSLHSNSPLDVSIKGQMIRDLLNLAGFLLPSKADACPGNRNCGTSPVMDRGRLAEIQNEEKMKRAHYLSQKYPDKDLYATVLDHLTPEDARVLVETEDELSRCGEFERVFPSPISSRYLRFFEQSRYYNILTNQWEQKYYTDREKGHNLLRNLCLMNFHHESVPQSPAKLPCLSESHLNGFSRMEVPARGKLLVSAEEHLTSLRSPQVHQESDPLLTQTLSNVPESALVM